MPQKIINVKPIKEKEVLKNFSNELLKNKHGQRDYTIFVFGIFYRIAYFRYIESES
jgi:hypothetical protein